MTPDELMSKTGAVLSQYRYVVKPLVAEVEAVWERFPTPIYNEARALMDHLSKCFPDKDDVAPGDAEIEKQLTKAEHHIKRMILDCYKLLNINSRQAVERFDRETRFLDLRTVDKDGNFSSEYARLSKEATELVLKAKVIEGTGNEAQTYEAYEAAHIKYVELTNLIEASSGYFKRARVKKIAGWLGWIVWSLITFIIGCILTNNNAAVADFFSGLLGR